MILTNKDIDAYMVQFDLPEERREVLRVVIDNANKVAADEAGWTDADGEASIFLRAAAHCLVVLYLCKPSKQIQRQSATAFWNLLRLHKQRRPTCRLH